MESTPPQTGLIPYIRVGDKSDMSSAVAELTGLRPLKDLAEDAKKSRQKLMKDLPKDCQAEIKTLDEKFGSERLRLTTLLKEHPEIDPSLTVPIPSSETCEQELSRLSEVFGATQSATLSSAKDILGETFDPTDTAAQKDLFTNVTLAVEAVRTANLRQLPSASRLRDLAEITPEQLTHAESLIATIHNQATALATLDEQPDVASRLRLYAKVANWIKEHDDATLSVDECPVCDTDLQGKIDRFSKRPISEHFRDLLESDCSYLGDTVAAWAVSVFNRLSGELPPSLVRELDKNLPHTPMDLISDALGTELFEQSTFAGVLAPLKLTVQQLCKRYLKVSDSFVDPPEVTLAAVIEAADQRLPKAIRRVRRAIAFSQWRNSNAEVCLQAFRAVIGTENDEGPISSQAGDSDLRKATLVAQLTVLDKLVKSSTPLRDALQHVAKLQTLITKRSTPNQQMAVYARAAAAIEELFPLGQLVDQQVGTLMTSLATETQRWKGHLYNSAFVHAPTISRADVDQDGRLVVDAESEGTATAAQHICNSSDLRATLLAFLFAFWKHIASTQGGLSLLLLDDLQELFDPPNRRRVANAIGQMADEGAAVILTSNDHRFARDVSDFAEQRFGSDRIDHRKVLPAKMAAAPMALSRMVESIHKKRTAFENDSDSEETARDYLNELRIFLESRLLNFFDVPDTQLPGRPTLADLISAIRRRVNQRQDGFLSGEVFRSLVNDVSLRQGSEFLQHMNDVHHGRAHLITCGDVAAISDDCKRVLKLVGSADEEYERWLRRDPPQITVNRPTPNVSGRSYRLSVPHIEVMAASTAGSPTAQLSEADEPFVCDWLTDHAIYINKTDNFGFAGQRHCRAIVRLDDSVPEENSWVIALHGSRTYARRLVYSSERGSQVALLAETTNPLNRPPALIVPLAEVRLLEVVGVLFDDPPLPQRRASQNEAEPDEQCQTLAKVKIAFTVSGDSALPLAIEGQTILGGRDLPLGDLQNHIGKLVALATTDGAAFKRIGETVPDAAHVRIFESVGGLGESFLARTDDEDRPVDGEEYRRLPFVKSAREILGVLYSPSTVGGG